MTLIRVGSYRLGKTLGVGSFSKVKLAEHEPTGKKVAVKILNRQKLRSQQMEDKLKREIKILKMCMHPHIIRLYEVIETSTDIYVVTEYSPGGELFDYIVERGRLSEAEARRFFQQIISGVEYCHKHMIAHRDLKPENLLLDEHSNVKIADFGLSNCMRDGCFLKTSCGSPNYAAPEVISGKLYAGPEVDVWSCGVIVYALLCGTLPFDDESIPYLFRKIKGGIYILPSYLSDLSKDIISKMLVTDPLKRINVSEIRKHPWFLSELPRYLSLPIRVGAHLEHVDENIVEQAAQCTNFAREKIVRHLRRGRRNHYTVAYHLFKDAQDELDMSTLDRDAATFNRAESSHGSGANLPGVSSNTARNPAAGGNGTGDNTGGDSGNDVSDTDDQNDSPTGPYLACTAIDVRRLPKLNSSALASMGSGGIGLDPNMGVGMGVPPAPGMGIGIGMGVGTDGRSGTGMNIGTGMGMGGMNVNNMSNMGMNNMAMPGMGVNMAGMGMSLGMGMGAMGGLGMGMNVNMNANGDTGMHIVEDNDQENATVGREWDVGIRCRQRNPVDAMMEVYHALHALGWRWKTPSNQSFQVRVLVERTGGAAGARGGDAAGAPAPGNENESSNSNSHANNKAGAQRAVRMCLQLFKSQSGYQLDVQRIDGDLIAFFSACCELKRELQQP